MKKSHLFLPLALAAGLFLGCKSTQPGVVANTTCPMSGKPVNEASYYEHNGTKIYTCCDKCVSGVKADPSSAMAKAYPTK